MVFIMLNMVTMAIEFDGMSQAYQDVLEIVNISFLTIFTLECVIKLLGLRLYYFKEPWNVFDFVVVLVSLLSQSLAVVQDNTQGDSDVISMPAGFRRHLV